MNIAIHDPARHGDGLFSYKTGHWLTASGLGNPAVILIHGFTAHGRYMDHLAEFFQGSDFTSIIFNYNSHLGIDRAARSLESKLSPLSKGLSQNGFVLLGHSMGGLVARYFAVHAEGRARAALKGIMTLGSPHNGTVSAIKGFMVAWGEVLSKTANPMAMIEACPSAHQLTRSVPLLDELNTATESLDLPALSISGGLPYIEWGKESNSRLGNYPQNAAIQRLLKELPNDGLVAESSSDITRLKKMANSTFRHLNTYTDYDRTNHTNLINNYEIAGLLLDWAKQIFHAERE